MDTELKVGDFVVVNQAKANSAWVKTMQSVYRVCKVTQTKYSHPRILLQDAKEYNPVPGAYSNVVEVPSEYFIRAYPETVDKYLNRTPPPKEPEVKKTPAENIASDFETNVDDFIHNLDVSYSAGMAIRFIIAAATSLDSKGDQLYALRNAREALDREISKVKK